MPYGLSDTLLALVLLSLLLGLAAGELAMLIRVGSASLSWLKRVWTWSASGKPLTCPTCLGAWCALLAFVAGTLLVLALGEEPTARVLILGFVAVPAAGAIAAVVQRWVLPDELVLPAFEEPAETDEPMPGVFTVTEMRKREAQAKKDPGSP